MAVPMMVKMPEPMTAPITSDVRLSHPRDFFNRTSAFSESDSSWSILLQRKSCDPTHALRSRQGKPAESNHPARYMRSESEPQFTPRRCIAQPPGGHSYLIHAGSSDLLELSVTFDKLFGAAPRKTHGKAAIFILAFHAHNRSDAVIGMAHLSSQQRIRIGATFRGGPPKRTCTGRTPGSHCRFLGSTADAEKEFLPGVRIFRIGLVTAGFADLRHRATNGVNQFAGNFRQKTRGQGSTQLPFIAENAAVHGARKRQ